MPWRTRQDRQTGKAELVEVDYNGSDRRGGSSLSMAVVEDAVSVAILQAVKDLGEVRVVGSLTVNVNIQLAAGGGASNIVGNGIGTFIDHGRTT